MLTALLFVLLLMLVLVGLALLNVAHQVEDAKSSLRESSPSQQAQAARPPIRPPTRVPT